MELVCKTINKSCWYRTETINYLVLNMNLHRLIYTSVRKAECDDQEISNILASAERNNAHADITGILLHSKDRFVQYIEGEPEKIKSLYDKIKGDSRHAGAMMRDFSPINQRLFPSWQMGHVDMGESLAFDTNIGVKEKEAFDAWFEDTKLTDSKLGIIKRFAKSQKSSNS